jgi:hypothetical protein
VTELLRILYWGGLAAWTVALVVVVVRIKLMQWRPPGGIKRLMRNFTLSFYAILAVMLVAVLLKIRLF